MLIELCAFQPDILQTNLRNINPNESAVLGIILEQNFLLDEKYYNNESKFVWINLMYQVFYIAWYTVNQTCSQTANFFSIKSWINFIINLCIFNKRSEVWELIVFDFDDFIGMIWNHVSWNLYLNMLITVFSCFAEMRAIWPGIQQKCR